MESKILFSMKKVDFQSLTLPYILLIQNLIPVLSFKVPSYLDIRAFYESFDSKVHLTVQTISMTITVYGDFLQL